MSSTGSPGSMSSRYSRWPLILGIGGTVLLLVVSVSVAIPLLSGSAQESHKVSLVEFDDQPVAGAWTIESPIERPSGLYAATVGQDRALVTWWSKDAQAIDLIDARTGSVIWRTSPEDLEFFTGADFFVALDENYAVFRGVRRHTLNVVNLASGAVSVFGVEGQSPYPFGGTDTADEWKTLISPPALGDVILADGEGFGRFSLVNPEQSIWKISNSEIVSHDLTELRMKSLDQGGNFVAGGIIFLGTTPFSVESGQPLPWTVSDTALKYDYVEESLLIISKEFGENSGAISRLDPDSGNKLWTVHGVDTESSISTGRTFYSYGFASIQSLGAFFVDSDSGSLSRLDLETGTVTWRTGENVYQILGGSSELGVIIVQLSANGGPCVALDMETGQQIFELTQIGKYPVPIGQTRNTIYIVDGYDGGLLALDISTGNVKWRVPTPNGNRHGYFAELGGNLVMMPENPSDNPRLIGIGPG